MGEKPKMGCMGKLGSSSLRVLTAPEIQSFEGAQRIGRARNGIEVTANLCSDCCTSSGTFANKRSIFSRRGVAPYAVHLLQLDANRVRVYPYYVRPNSANWP